MISSWQPLDVSNVHLNDASLAEQQLAGELADEGGLAYYNEATSNFSEWEADAVSHEGVVNWYEHALDGDALLLVPDDAEFPVLSDLGAPQFEGVVVEFKTYLELTAGYHQFGLFSEGGHKVNATHSPEGPVLSLFDNADGSERVPTYYGRSQIFDVVAQKDGLYPIRLLWFQSHSYKEPGMMLEFYSISDRQIHLVNDASNPKAVRAFQTAVEVEDVTPEISMVLTGDSVMLEWVGMLQMADDPSGPWVDVADDGQSPMVWDTSEASKKFARSVAD
jgi:hypothetical protein